MQFNLSTDTLDTLSFHLDAQASALLKKLNAAKAPGLRTKLQMQLTQVRDLQTIFLGEAPERAPLEDFLVAQDGSVFTFDVQNATARAFVQQHVALESWQWLGQHRFAVDHRLAPELVCRLRDDGFRVEVR